MGTRRDDSRNQDRDYDSRNHREVAPRRAEAMTIPVRFEEQRRRREREQLRIICMLIALVAVLIVAVVHVHAESAAMPNPKLTPGDAGDLSAKQLCDSKFHTDQVRSVSEKEKREVYAEYGRANHEGACAKGCEVDHLISLEL